MLQKDGFFRKRENNNHNPIGPLAAPLPSSPVPAAAPETLRPEKSESRREAKLVVGPDIKMKGAEISDCDTLVVEGRMEATLDSRVLEIAQNGVFHGTIAVDSAEIHGRFEGELTVRKQLVILGTAKVSGKIRYAKLRIEEGAELSGEISMLDKASAGISVGRRAANAG